MKDTTDLDTINLDEMSIYSPHTGARWTRIRIDYVSPKLLSDLDEDYHIDGSFIVLHRVLRRGELKVWMEKTLEYKQREEQAERMRERRGVSGHTWLGREDKRDVEDDRDLRQESLDRVLVGDMKEAELRHFSTDAEEPKG